MNDNLTILSIETSCDETSVAVVENGTKVLSNVISSQIDLHKKFGGVVPEIASRKHIEKIDIVIKEALKEANINLQDVDVIGVTYGPGLVGALLVGLAEAKALAFALNKPLVGVHHIEGHISANYIQNPDFKPPFMCLVVSGGHSHLVYVKDYGEYEIVGKTRDDAVGEAFDKVARTIGLGYPGGPKIDKLAKEGTPSIDFPRTYLEPDSFDFSFSGIKSAVLNYLNQSKMKNEEINEANIAASFQEAVVEVLVNKTIKAAKKYNTDKIALAGGVAANSHLRKEMQKACDKEKVFLQYPDMVYCTDNAAMIGSAAYYDYIKGIKHGMDLNAIPNLKIGDKK